MSDVQEKSKILVVDDAVDTVEVLRRNLTLAGYKVFTAPGVAEAIRVLEETPVELVVTDMKMPGTSGLDLVRHVRENLRDTEVMMITGYATVEGAVEAVKTGAEEYLAKPFTDEELLNAVSRALENRKIRLAGRNGEPPKGLSQYGLIGESESMREAFRTLGKAADVTATVLITGESGTGKELVARAIHYSGILRSGPFVPVNCGGIPEGLLESELFGHLKGAFTGATETRAGFFQTADGGTIFLDEISEISRAMQVKLLRVLQDKQVCMVGDTKARKVDARILAATNKDLRVLIDKGLFREDLYFRLNVIAVDVPPLRTRGDDIWLLAQHFVEKFAEDLGKEPIRLSDRALRVIREYDWPGNVRELENLVHRLSVMAEEVEVDASDLPSLMKFSAPRNSGLHRTLAEVEAEHIRNVLAGVEGNKTRAAEILGIDRKTLREKLKRHSLET
ncbi:MAG: sigma-54-dependent transcriptional regulator [Planctomycetota bacterium]|jgi:DNA-binding NtrC family response regulator